MTDIAALRTGRAVVLAALFSAAGLYAAAAPPLATAQIAYDNANPILLKGKVEDVQVLPAGITLTISAASLSVDGHASPETQTWIVNAGGSMAAPQVIAGLNGKTLALWGYRSSDHACASACRMSAADYVIVGSKSPGARFETIEPNPVLPFPNGGYAFAAKFDAEAWVLIKGVVEKVEVGLPYTQVWVRGAAESAVTPIRGRGNGAAPGGQEKLWLADGPRPAALSDETHLKLTPGARVTIRGYLAKDKTCDPACRVNARDIAFN